MKIMLLGAVAAFLTIFAEFAWYWRKPQKNVRRAIPKLAVPPAPPLSAAELAYQEAWRHLRNVLESKQYIRGGRFGNPPGFRVTVFRDAACIVLVLSNKPDAHMVTRLLCYRNKPEVLKIDEDRLVRANASGVLPEQATNTSPDSMTIVDAEQVSRLAVRLSDRDPSVAMYCLGALHG